MKTPITEIEQITRHFAIARDELVERAVALQDELEAVKRKHLKQLKFASDATAAAQAALHNAIDGNRELFAKPRSVIFHGIKVGLQKSKDAVEYPHLTQLVSLMKLHGPDTVERLCKVKYKPLQAALQALDDADLKRIGCTRKPGTDSVLIKPADAGIDKLIASFLNAAAEEIATAEEGDE